MIRKVLLAIGLMSGTSRDGIDIALIKTDGENIFEIGACATFEYDKKFRHKLEKICQGQGDEQKVAYQLTLKHADVVQDFMRDNNLLPEEIDIIGFHGHTILHEPEKGKTHQIGDAGLLAQLTNMDVISNFRGNDIKNGGQGAPLVPVYHRALMQHATLPLVIVNIGGVANLTWIERHKMVAFDTGPGNGLLDDWIGSKTQLSYDEGGKIAKKGTVDHEVVKRVLGGSYFKKDPPKSLDRHSFDNISVEHLNTEDGAATLSCIIAKTIAKAACHFPGQPTQWIISGGGRHNTTLLEMLRREIDKPVVLIEEMGYNGDAIEAQAFAFLAVRSLYGMPLTFPATTGVRHPVSGGVFYPV